MNKKIFLGKEKKGILFDFIKTEKDLYLNANENILITGEKEAFVTSYLIDLLMQIEGFIYIGFIKTPFYQEYKRKANQQDIIFFKEREIFNCKKEDILKFVKEKKKVVIEPNDFLIKSEEDLKFIEDLLITISLSGNEGYTIVLSELALENRELRKKTTMTEIDMISTNMNLLNQNNKNIILETNNLDFIIKRNHEGFIYRFNNLLIKRKKSLTSLNTIKSLYKINKITKQDILQLKNDNVIFISKGDKRFVLLNIENVNNYQSPI